MTQNTNPIFPLTAQTPVAALLSTAATSTKAYDGTEAVGTSCALLGTAGANGSRVDRVSVQYGSTAGNAPSGTTNQTVLRLFLNNGSANTTATNNTLIKEILVPSVVYSNTGLNGGFDVLVGLTIPAGYKLYGLISAAVGGTAAALAILAVMGDY